VALPDSIIGAFFIMMVAGFSMNVITLLSLSLAVGLLIDDSIVVRENIFRHIEEGMKPKEAAEKGTNEVALAVISTTLSIMSVFLPISFLSGMIGQFFKQFGLTVAFALAISLLDAFTTAPMLSAYWYKESDPSKRRGFLKWIYDLSESWNRFYAELNKYYRKILNWSLERKKFIIVMSVALFIGSIIISLPFIGKRFMYADNGMIMANIETYSGAPLNKMSGYMSMIEDFLSKEPDIESYFVMAGANMNGNIGTNLGSLMISMKPLSKRKLTTDQMKDKLRKYVTDNKLDRFINLSISSGMGGGSSESYTPVLINITGEDLKELEKIATQVKNIVLETPGSADVEISMKPGTPEVVLKVDVVKAEKVGITTAEIAGVVRNMIQGTTVSNFRKGEKQYDIKMRLDKNDRKTINDLKNIILTTHMGRKIPLTSVADFVYGSGPTEIRRENKARIVKVSANIAPGANMGTVNSKIKQRIYKEIILPRGYYISMGGQSKEFASLVKEMLKAIFLALLFMYMILASLYNSILQPLYIMVAIPLAIIGSFLALLITGYDLDTFGFIGILMVLGLVAKNGILLLDFINKKREQGMDIRESILQAAPIRLRPILMTSFAMIAGMLPIAMSLGEGSKGREGLAIVVIGGLLTSTFLTLVVVPVVYEYFEKRISAWQKTKASSANIKRKK
jgi:HAE1 family hydrophobic/amphiphilic exporter-1